MNLAASVVCRNELGRYLEPCVDHLLEFCDVVCALDDASEDGSYGWLAKKHGVRVAPPRRDSEFFRHEGQIRQSLLEWTLKHDPTHVIAIDLDEFVSDGRLLRAAIATTPAAVWSLRMREVWELDGDCLCIREDGGWRTHAVPAVWKVPDRPDPGLRIADRALACGRVPVTVDGRAHTSPLVGDLLHFGWANQEERQQRYDRYATHDGGRYHASAHLQSILWPTERVELHGTRWPAGLEGLRPRIAGAAGMLAR